MPDKEQFLEEIRDAFGFLLDDGYELLDEYPENPVNAVQLVSSRIIVGIGLSPRGEFEITVMRTPGRLARLFGHRPDERQERWEYEAMLGSADLGRLLEIGVEKLRADPRVLEGDRAYFRGLGEERRRRNGE